MQLFIISNCYFRPIFEKEKSVNSSSIFKLEPILFPEKYKIYNTELNTNLNMGCNLRIETDNTFKTTNFIVQ